ncbi:MAG: L-lactate MFS transporter [Methanomicrobiales archaeon]|nr:OFA family MFS transporter [Methanoregulaceae archaeon]MCC7468979.1 OFA family MFS transporter [Burkholderiaceae bacterium]NLH26149.1 OFA family MFS transporter [Methanomicrobiales archaeon]HMZ31030.1 OFA family MFS transporter [Methanoregulaceae archaeon]HNW80306.1 OFA family MFS transporter [Methanoregulaceae archaeon]
MAPEESLFGMPAERGRWGLVIVGMIINLCLGTIYSWSVFVGPLTSYFQDTLGLTVTPNEILMPFSVFLAFFAIAMTLTGKYIESIGPRKITILGGILTGLGWLLASTVTSVWMLYIVYGVIGGIGVGIAYGVPVAVAARWFPDRRGAAVGLTLLGFGFSAFITANIAGYLIGTTGVMNTFRIFGIVFMILIVLLALPLRFPPEGWRPAGWVPPVPKKGEELCEYDRSAMIRTSTFYGLWFCYFIGCLAGLMAISIAKPVGTEIGIATGLATILVGFFAIFNGGGRPVFGALTDRFNPRNTAILSFVLIALASSLLWQMPSVPVYILAFAILWGCLGGWLAIAPTATGSYFGTCDYPRCYGVVFLAYGAGAIAGPQLAGFIKTTTGNYLGVFPYVLILALLGILVAMLLMKPPKIRR